MEKKTRARRPKTATPQAIRAKEIWSENLRAVIAHKFPLAKYRTRTEQEKALAKAAGISHSSVQRAIDPNSNFGTGLDQLVAIAGALETPVVDLLRNGYAASLYGKVVDGPQEELQRLPGGLPAN